MTRIAKMLLGCGPTMTIAATVGGSTALARQAFHPENRSVGSLAIDPTQPSVLYAGSGVGLFKTTDSGVTWSNESNVLGTPVVLDVVLDPTRPRTLYVATWAGFDPAGAFKSSDGAATWATLPSGPDIVRIAVHPSNPRVLYAGGMSAVFKSRDGGATWRRVLHFRNGHWALALAIDPHAPSTVYAGTGGGVFKTSDGGRHWRRANRGLPKPSGRDRVEGFVRAIVLDPKHTRNVYVGTERGFFRSTNGGKHWLASAGHAVPDRAWALAIHPRNPRILYLGSWDGVFESTDGGKHWRKRGSGLEPRELTGTPWISAVAIDPSNPQTVYAGGNGGVFKSVDGGEHRVASGSLRPLRR